MEMKYNSHKHYAHNYFFYNKLQQLIIREILFSKVTYK